MPPQNKLAPPLNNSLAYSVPRPLEPGMLPPPPSRFVPRRELENFSAGLGHGITSSLLEGTKQMLTEPVATAQALIEAARQIGADPRIVLDMLRAARQKAMSGSLGLGELIGENITPGVRGRRIPAMRELDVYHGTPHRFPATEANPLGEFDASKIGTGEGAQAYGHGIYFAESPKVAGGYAEKLAYTSKIPMSGYDVASRSNPKLVQKLKAVFGDDEIRINRAIVKPTEFKNLSPELKAEINAFKRQSKGTLYKADLPDEMIDRMLDWDKPLSEQPAAVRNAFNDLLDETGNYQSSGIGGTGNLSGSDAADLYNDLKGMWSENYGPDDLVNIDAPSASAAVSEFLRRRGIPGIKYKDAGSRGQGGSGTRNFVVFPGEEKKVRILERK